MRCVRSPMVSWNKTWESTRKLSFCNRHKIPKLSRKQKASTKHLHHFNSKTVWWSENHETILSFYFFLWPWEVEKCQRNWASSASPVILNNQLHGCHLWFPKPVLQKWLAVSLQKMESPCALALLGRKHIQKCKWAHQSTGHWGTCVQVQCPACLKSSLRCGKNIQFLQLSFQPE